MKRLIVAAVLIITVGTIGAGKYYWDQQQEDTLHKARVALAEKSSLGSGNEYAADTGTTNTEVKKTDSEVRQSEITDSNKTVKQKDSGDSAGNEKSAKAEGTRPLQEIKDYYDRLFNELEKQVKSQSDQLVVQAKADQVSGKYTKAKLAVKYQDLAKQLEQNADKTFNSLYEKVQYDLADNGYDSNEAEEYRTSYNKKKKEQTAAIFSKVKDL